MIPSPLDLPPIIGRNTVFLIDDLIVKGLPDRVGGAEQLERSGPTEALEETLDALHATAPEGNVDVIITMQRQHFKMLRTLSPELVEQFDVVWLDTTTETERRSYITTTAKLFGLTFASESEERELEDKQQITFGEIFNFFWVLNGKGVGTINRSDIENFLSLRGKLWRREVYPQLDKYERQIIDCVGNFLHFGLGTPISVIIEVCVSEHGG